MRYLSAKFLALVAKVSAYVVFISHLYCIFPIISYIYSFSWVYSLHASAAPCS